MFLDASLLQTFAVVAGVGAVAGLIGGFIGSASNLFATMLMGVIGGVALSAIFKAFGVPAVYGVGADDFSLVWAAVGGLVLGYFVGHANV